MSTVSSTENTCQQESWRVRGYIFAGLCASLDSIGLGRFAFTPLIPEIISANWFSAPDVAYLAAANLPGYLLGALTASFIVRYLEREHTLRLMMVLISASFFACATPVSLTWYFGWRFVSGYAGGVVMVLVAATILPHVAVAKKAAASGAIFLGLGLGIAASGTTIPVLLKLGLPQTWIGLGLVSSVLTAASWLAWPSRRADLITKEHNQSRSPVRQGREVYLLYLQYALMAAAAVPTMVFLVDYVARGLGAGGVLGAALWAVYGLGAIGGPPLYGYLAKRLSANLATGLVSLTIAVGLILFAVAQDLVFLTVLAGVLGTFAPGMVPLTLVRVHEVVAHNQALENRIWGHASIISAAALALAAYGFSALFNFSGGDHRLLFLTAAALLFISLIAGLVLRDTQTGKPADELRPAKHHPLETQPVTRPEEAGR